MYIIVRIYLVFIKDFQRAFENENYIIENLFIYFKIFYREIISRYIQFLVFESSQIGKALFL
jgi:hypothetical protein